MEKLQGHLYSAALLPPRDSPGRRFCIQPGGMNPYLPGPYVPAREHRQWISSHVKPAAQIGEGGVYAGAYTCLYGYCTNTAARAGGADQEVAAL